MLFVSSVENLQSILVDWLVRWSLSDFYKDFAIHPRLSLWLLLRSCNTSAIVFVTSVKILQYIGDVLCDVCLKLAKHRRIILVVSSVENLESILIGWLVWWCLCDFYKQYKDLAIHRRLSLWRLLRTCKTSANYIGCEFCWELAKDSRWLTSVVMSLWFL